MPKGVHADGVFAVNEVMLNRYGVGALAAEACGWRACSLMFNPVQACAIANPHPALAQISIFQSRHEPERRVL